MRSAAGHGEEEEEEDRDTAVKVLTNVTAGGDGKATRKKFFPGKLHKLLSPTPPDDALTLGEGLFSAI